MKKGFCILTQIPASEEINKINKFLRNGIITDNLYAPFEDYVYSLLFLTQKEIREEGKVDLNENATYTIHLP